MTDAKPDNHPFLEFLVAFNHDLRTPLNSIIGFSRVILKGIDGPINDVQAEDLASIHDGGQNMLAMLNEVVDMAKLETGAIDLLCKTLDLREIIDDTVNKVESLVEDKAVTFNVELPPEPLPIWGDESRTRQILFNLASFCARNLRAGAVTLQANAWGDRARIIVSDNGEGWPPEEVAVMLQPYRPPAEIQHIGGAGLSLAIAQRMAELQGGSLAVESHVGRGTTFTLVLPLKPGDASAAKDHRLA